jgi:release factor glutamine methyltransferase
LKILDLGTGSGCILAALLSEYPNALGVGLEASPAARRFAVDNLERLGLASRSVVRPVNWSEALPGAFDVVVSNPPYVRTADIAALAPDVAEYEPTVALDGGPDGLSAYRILFGRIGRWLPPTGRAFFEIGRGQETDLVTMAELFGWSLAATYSDLAGVVRVLVIKRL